MTGKEEVKHAVIKGRLDARLSSEINLLTKNILLIIDKFSFALDK